MYKIEKPLVITNCILQKNVLTEFPKKHEGFEVLNHGVLHDSRGLEMMRDGADDAQLQQVVTKVGRMQFAVLGAALAGFICLGKEFIALWLNEGFEDVYYLSLFMMIPVTFTLVQNVCLSILRAKNMMKFRTGSLICTTILNLVLTIVGTRLPQ